MNPTDQLIADAVERLRTKWTRSSLIIEKDGSFKLAYVEDLSVIADAYLAEKSMMNSTDQPRGLMKLHCGHHISNQDRTVESGTVFCRLCDLESRCRDAERMERELLSRVRELEAERGGLRDALDTIAAWPTDWKLCTDGNVSAINEFAYSKISAPLPTPGEK